MRIRFKIHRKYILLLKQTYVIFRLGSFSRNLRNELKYSKKIYFYVNGIRNALIAKFEQIESHNDIGSLWENYLISERIKHLNYSGAWVNYWFWRTKEQKEINFIEESDGKLTAYELKWAPDIHTKLPKQFQNTYGDINFRVIHHDNFEELILDKRS
ncbi:MAG: DUF4143 domain-containing protein [Prolixibacteraceae bacterium]